MERGREGGTERERKSQASILYMTSLDKAFIEKCPIEPQGGVDRRLSPFLSTFYLCLLANYFVSLDFQKQFINDKVHFKLCFNMLGDREKNPLGKAMFYQTFNFLHFGLMPIELYRSEKAYYSIKVQLYKVSKFKFDYVYEVFDNFLYP